MLRSVAEYINTHGEIRSGIGTDCLADALRHQEATPSARDGSLGGHPEKVSIRAIVGKRVYRLFTNRYSN